MRSQFFSNVDNSSYCPSRFLKGKRPGLFNYCVLCQFSSVFYLRTFSEDLLHARHIHTHWVAAHLSGQLSRLSLGTGRPGPSVPDLSELGPLSLGKRRISRHRPPSLGVQEYLQAAPLSPMSLDFPGTLRRPCSVAMKIQRKGISAWLMKVF